MAKSKAQQEKDYNRQIRYAHERVADPTASQMECAIRAGYAESTARKNVWTIEQLPQVQEIIQRAKQEAAEKAGVSAERIIEEYAKIAFADIKDFLSFKTVKTVVDRDEEGEPIIDYGQIIDVKDSDEVDGTIINEVSISKDGTFKFKLHDKKGALDALAKIKGLLKDEVKVQIVKKLEDFF